MPPSARPPSDNAPPLAHLGWELRKRREQMALEREQVAEALRYSLEVVKKVENGTYHADVRHYLARWGEVYDFDEQLRALWARVREAREEQAAAEAHSPMRRDTFLKGILAGSTGVVVGQLPFSPDPSPAVADAEAVASLRVVTGHYRQLEAHTPAGELIEPARSHLGLIVGTLGRWPGGPGRMSLAAAASEAAGLVGWLAMDLHDHAAARKHYKTAISFATQAKSNLLRGYMLGSMAAWVAERGNGTDAIRLVDAARPLVLAGPPTTASAWLAAIEALAHTAMGDEAAARAALDQAEALAAVDGTISQWPWVYRFDPAKVERYRATCYTRLRLPRLAGPVLERAIPALPPDATKPRGLLLADLAEVTLDAGDVDRAASLIAEAFDIAVVTGSRRIMARVREGRGRLTHWDSASAVRALDRHLLGPFLGWPAR